MKEYVTSAVCLLLFVCSCFGQSPNDDKNSPPEYDLSVRLLPDSHRLEAVGTIRLPASETPKSELQLFLTDRMSDLKVEVIEPKANARISTFRFGKNSTQNADRHRAAQKLTFLSFGNG